MHADRKTPVLGFIEEMRGRLLEDREKFSIYTTYGSTERDTHIQKHTERGRERVKGKETVLFRLEFSRRSKSRVMEGE